MKQNRSLSLLINKLSNRDAQVWTALSGAFHHRPIRFLRGYTWLNWVLVTVILITTLLAPWAHVDSVIAAGGLQEDSEARRTQDLLDRMTPEERVGQLFLVTFTGTKVGPETPIFDLIYDYYIGGVIMLSDNDNFTTAENTLVDTWSTINQLQTNRFSSSQETRSTPEGEDFNPAFIPLFIGLSQEGDSAPTDQIHSQLTPLPSQLAIGATWNPDLARQVGTVAGRELSSLGFNLLLGPSLDINEDPQIYGTGDIGVRTFGGDPFWVGEMGRAYITGVHEGSNERMAVVGKHFPGLGSTDRLPVEEVATVRKSLEQLSQIELAPFFAVTGYAQSESETVDALLTSHIRYQSQENIRATTRPVSFDQAALNSLMELPPLANWRTDGGVMISDDIGSRAVRNFYDPTGEGFNARRAALDAFLAGNDLLYMGGFLQEEFDPEGVLIFNGYDDLVDTIEFFTQKYREDPDFASRVDESVLRILSLKFKLYNFFTLALVLASGDLSTTGTEASVPYGVAQKAATLIDPTAEELENVLPETPTRSERIVIFTDSYSAQQCTACPEAEIFPVAGLESAIINLYGPDAGNVVFDSNISSHSFVDLQKVLDGVAPSSEVDTNLRRAQWIIFMMRDVDPKRPESYALQRFLSERPDYARDKRVIAFAAHAPYFLDATDISKLTAYYALYSKTPAFTDVAARLLFKEIPVPEGASPVSIPGIGYDLISITSPDPDQEIPLMVDLPGMGIPDETEPPRLVPNPRFRVGDSIPIRTGVILDNNGHPVPDQTPVEFTFFVNDVEAPSTNASTVNGIAKASFSVEMSGIITIQATAGSAQSTMLTIEIPEVRLSPTPVSTLTPTATPTQTPTVPPIQPTPTAVIIIQAESSDSTGLWHWVVAALISFAVGWIALRTGSIMGQVRWGVRWGLAAVIGGLLAYTYAILGSPGTEGLITTPYTSGVMVFTFCGALAGWGIGAVARLLSTNNSPDEVA